MTIGTRFLVLSNALLHLKGSDFVLNTNMHVKLVDCTEEQLSLLKVKTRTTRRPVP